MPDSAAGLGIVRYPAPPQEPLSQDFQLKVAGQEVPVYSCRVSAVPFNQLYSGYQRPLNQTELASFAYWDCAGPVDVEVFSRRLIETVVIRPLARGIQPAVSGNRISFRLPGPGQVTVEVNGLHFALHLFANPPEGRPALPSSGHDAEAWRQAPGVRYFAPGVHEAGKIELRDNETLYVAGGAVVYGTVHANGARNIRILGRGILDASQYERGKGGGCIRLTNCRNVEVEGVVLRDPDVWCFTLLACTNVLISNVKLIGLWRYNSDGIDICNSQNVIVRDSFIRSFDDSIVVKGLKHDTHPDTSVQNVLAERCVVWCDWGRALEVGAETVAEEFRGIVFRDIDVLRASYIAMDIQHGDRAAIRDVTFENIRLEIDDVNLPLLISKSASDVYPAHPPPFCPRLLVVEIKKTGWNKDAQRGTVEGVIVRDIFVTGKPFPSSLIRGFDAEHKVKGVTIRNIRFNGRPATDLAGAGVTVADFAEDVRFVPPA